MAACLESLGSVAGGGGFGGSGETADRFGAGTRGSVRAGRIGW